jgi:hypothetical protein
MFVVGGVCERPEKACNMKSVPAVLDVDRYLQARCREISVLHDGLKVSAVECG